MSTIAPIKLLALGCPEAARDLAGVPGLEVLASGSAGSAGSATQQQAECDAVLLGAATRAELALLDERVDLPALAFMHAVVVLAGEADEALEAELLRLGVEAIVAPGSAAELARTLRHAVERKRVERSARAAYATDLSTGLPHETQLVEHMTQLLALRERQPSPMALVALRIEGYAGAAARLGGEAANVLRRKVAVRLRSGLRASDVVASIGPDMFGVLLGHIDAQGDAERVAAKLVRALQQPIVVAGQPCRVAATVGLAQYPVHGADARTLLRRASAQAGGVATLGGEAVAVAFERNVAGLAGAAANDDLP